MRNSGKRAALVTLLAVLLALTACESTPREGVELSIAGIEEGRSYIDTAGKAKVAQGGSKLVWVQVHIYCSNTERRCPAALPKLAVGGRLYPDKYAGWAGHPGRARFAKTCSPYIEPGESCTGWGLFVLPDTADISGAYLQ